LTIAKPQSVGATPGKFAYASRESEWRALAHSLCGDSSSNVIDALVNLRAGSRTAIVTFGDSDISGGRLAAALVLRGVCCLNTVKIPPVQIVVAPDSLATRAGYLDFHIAASEVRRLMDAWRLRAVGSGESPGDLTAVEQSLNRRAKRRPTISTTSAKAENLHLFFPAYRFIDSDTLATVASRDHLRADDALPAITFVDSAAVHADQLRAWGIDPEWVIVDAGNSGRDLDGEAVAKWQECFPRARHVCLIPGLSHHLIDRLRGRGIRLSWLRDAEARDPAGFERLRCVEVDSQSDPEDLKRLLTIASNARRHALEWSAFNTLRAAIHVITSLPVDRSYYDEAAVARFTVPTTEELLESLARCELRLAMSHPAYAADLGEARSILAHIASRSDVESDRKKQLFSAVEEAVQAGKELWVIVRNRTVRAAVEACLTEAFDTDLSDLNAIGVRIESRRDLRLRLLPQGASILWTSYGGIQDLDAVLNSATRSVTLLANGFERELFVHDLQTWANRGAATQQGAEGLGVLFPGKKRLVEGISELAKRVRSTTTAPPLGQDAASDIYRLLDDTVGPWCNRSAPGEVRSDIMRRARAVAFQDGSTSYFPEEAIVTVVRGHDDEPVDLSVADLLPGDRVVFVEMAIGQTIYELMQDALSRSPLVGAAAQMVGLWHRAIATASARAKIVPHQIHRELRTRGSSITTVQTIRMWLRGAVLGPRDIEDVDRLAEVLGIGQRDPSILPEIKSSIRSLRNVYRQFAKVVYRTILTGGTGRALSDAEQALIDEHGISLSDLREAITLETVVKVAAEAELRPADAIGRRGK
jgi:hypothetical protein